MARLDDIIDLFQSVDVRTRLDLLLDFARQLPPLPPHLRDQREAEAHRVPECQTPLFLWAWREDERLRLAADAAEEAVTVRGFVSILVAAYDGGPPEDAAAAPLDLLHRLGLAEQIRMTRSVGLTALVGRLRREAAACRALAGPAAPVAAPAP